jgi:hypothetical protein
MASIKLAYGASAALTITLASLGNSTTAGRQSDVVDNTSNLYVDALVGGKITTGSTPTVGTIIEVWAFAPVESGTPIYPDVLGASDAAVTFTSRDILVSSMALLSAMVVSATSDRAYWMKPTSVAAAFGGVLPFKWGIVVINSTAVALNATGGNHTLYYKPVYATVA